MGIKIKNFHYRNVKSILLPFYQKHKKMIWIISTLCITVSVSLLTSEIWHLYHNKKVNEAKEEISRLKEQRDCEHEQLIQIQGGMNGKSDDKRPRILELLRQSRDLVTTEIRYKQIANVEVRRGKITWNPSTWSLDKLGEHNVIMPVEVTIRYGFDLSQMSIEDIKVDDENYIVWISLPEPHIVDTDFNIHIDQKNIVTMSTSSLAGPPTTKEIEEVLNKQKDYIIEESKRGFKENAYKDIIMNNARNVFEVMLQKIGYKNTKVEIVNNSLNRK